MPLSTLSRRSSDDPCFGIHFGAAHAFETAGVFNYIVQNSPNVGAAIANGVRYLRLIIDAAELSVEFAGSRHVRSTE